ncbi:MAG: tetratricopeptide repeat protein [Luteolibacter sp.]
MIPRRSIHFAPAGVFMALWLAVVPAGAQDAGLTALVDKSLAAMNEEKWQESLDLSSDAVSRFGKDDPLKRFGPQFGALYYRKGVCEMKLGKWADAMRSFEICYRDFPNEGADRGNVFQKQALLKWGEAAMGAGDWQRAAGQFRKFLSERDKVNDAFPHGVFYINLAVCHYRLGNIPDGNENLEIAIYNKDRFPTPEAGIIAGFEALVTTAVAKRREQAITDFIDRNRGELVVEPCVMQRYSPVFLKLAGDAVAADMTRAALTIYQLVPSTQAALDDARARLANSADPGEKKRLEQDIAGLEGELDGKNPPEMIRLSAVAFLHEKNGNVRGAFAAYQQLELYFPKARNREENLFNLVRTASLAAGPDRARGHAETFIRDFPESPRVPELRSLMR